MLMTQLLAKGQASVHQQLACYSDGFPQTLFRVLVDKSHAEAVFSKPPCMRDEMSARLLQKFPSPEALCSEEATVILASIAHNYSVDTYEVERSFSDLRRRIKSKPTQTWTPCVADIAAESMLRATLGSSSRRSEYVLGKTAGTSAKEKAARARERVRLFKSYSTPWKVHLAMCLRGRPWLPSRIKDASRSYHALTRDLLHATPGPKKG